MAPVTPGTSIATATAIPTGPLLPPDVPPTGVL